MLWIIAKSCCVRTLEATEMAIDRSLQQMDKAELGVDGDSDHRSNLNRLDRCGSCAHRFASRFATITSGYDGSFRSRFNCDCHAAPR